MAVALSERGERLTTFAIPIEKIETTPDDDVIVWGKATDGSVDSDEQIVDPDWSAKAIQEWLSTGGNVRVQHNPQRDPAGKGVEVQTDHEGATWVKSLIVEPVAKMLVRKGILRAYSVGISRPDIHRDPVARGGRIKGDSARIAEISLVDRPANANCGFQLVKRDNTGHAEYSGEVFGDGDTLKSLGVDITKVGPKGYIHGWIHVGTGGPDVHADSLAQHIDEHGHLSSERSALHDKIVSNITGGHKSHNHPIATFLGGGPASGKSKVMLSSGGDSDSAVIDADGIKGQLPEYKALVDAGDKRAAAYAHEESSTIAAKALKAAADKKINFTLDGTGDSSFEKLSGKADQARKSGHLVVGKYVTVDTDEAIRRAEKRAQRTGRMVPASVIKEIHGAVSDTFAKAIKHNTFDAAELWDNNGREPKLVGSKPLGGTWTVHDPEAWQRFLNKGSDAHG